MGCYIYINENEQKSKRTVEDTEVNELLKEALKYDKTIMLSSSVCFSQTGVIAHVTGSRDFYHKS